MTSAPICRVAVAAPLHRLFDYICAANVLPGQRVKVPFGRREVVAVVVENAVDSLLARDKLKHVIEVMEPQIGPILSAHDLKVLRFAADYYHYPVGEIILGALPKSLRAGGPARAQRDVLRLSEQGAATDAATLARAPQQQAVFQRLRLSASGLDAATLRRREPKLMAAARRLMKSGLVDVEQRSGPAEDFRAANIAQGPTLTPAQHDAVTAIDAAQDFTAFLLFGVTGSGKTEVYLRAIERVIRAGQQALVLVPEIALTPQLVTRFERRFEAPVVSMHSGLSEGDRVSAWRAAREGQAAIVIGTRSAVFMPLARPGIMIVDEEHDGSFKQQEGFRYSGRDVAIYRARTHNIPIVLGSATPTLESLHNAAAGRYQRLDLPQRAGPGTTPEIRLVDLREEPIDQGLSGTLLRAVGRHVDNGGQVMLFLNRRGYAPAWFCSGCGELASCAQCDASMTYHHSTASLRCHHCGASRRAPKECEHCGEEHRPVGQGTERLEETLERHFPKARIARLDRDTTRRRGALDDLLERMRRRQIDILVGTQMLTKGHHFPEVSMVGIVYADQGLFSTDFRAAERLAQTVVQVCGRAGRGSRAGEVFIQTAFVEHPLLQQLIKEGYEAFADGAIAEREAALWPPFSHLALIRARAKDAQSPLRFLEEVRAALPKMEQVSVLGPASAPMLRRADRYHAQLLLQADNRRALNALLASTGDNLSLLARKRHVQFSIDVDPVDLY
ncbi:MAG: primosomal protein N' [Gammaproteobacteria bacterium]